MRYRTYTPDGNDVDLAATNREEATAEVLGMARDGLFIPIQANRERPDDIEVTEYETFYVDLGAAHAEIDREEAALADEDPHEREDAKRQRRSGR